MATVEDAELVGQFLAGDEDAFAAICRRYANLVYSVAWRSLGAQHLAEDAAEATFATAARRMSTLREPAKLRSWLCAICRAEVSHVLRSQFRDRRRTERVANLRPVEMEIDPDGSQYASALLDLARDGLSADDQELLGLVLADPSGSELADALGIDLGAADTRKSRLYDRLRIALEAYWVTRPGRRPCPELTELVARRKEVALSRPLCRAIDRHCRTCEVCDQERRSLDPLALLAGVPVPSISSQLLNSMLRPIEVSGRGHAEFGRREWRSDGFPHSSRRGMKRTVRTSALVTVGAVVVAVSSLFVAGALGGPPPIHDDAQRSSGPKTTTTVTSSRTIPTSSSPVGLASSTTTSTVPAAPLPTIPVASIVTTTIAVPHASEKKATRHAGASGHSKPTTTTTTTTTVAAALVLQDTSIDLGSSTATASVEITDPGAPLAWTASTNASWLSVAPDSGTVSYGSPGSITLMMARSAAPTGALSATVTFTSATSSASISVSAIELPPPSVTAVNAPTPIYCSGTFSAAVSAPAGVSSVEFSFTLPNATAPTTTAMVLNGSSYSAPVGPFAANVSGQATWSIVVTDADGKTNTSPSTGSVFVTARGCPN